MNSLVAKAAPLVSAAGRGNCGLLEEVLTIGG
jgi:hypothetical protein